ncbi:unnamed protein product [Caenorhabditis auriculariae]|uniref:Uncharacterized protein n=1 Tax=Caenorhabditis auriculariae TaxID=2777116 RepID=A0A8S1HBU7_9PELO|nr:unnamed protein product [Caenorhabditis auriculariae]
MPLIFLCPKTMNSLANLHKASSEDSLLVKDSKPNTPRIKEVPQGTEERFQPLASGWYLVLFSRPRSAMDYFETVVAISITEGAFIVIAKLGKVGRFGRSVGRIALPTVCASATGMGFGVTLRIQFASKEDRHSGSPTGPIY